MVFSKPILYKVEHSCARQSSWFFVAVFCSGYCKNLFSTTPGLFSSCFIRINKRPALENCYSVASRWFQNRVRNIKNLQINSKCTKITLIKSSCWQGRCNVARVPGKAASEAQCILQYKNNIFLKIEIL